MTHPHLCSVERVNPRRIPRVRDMHSHHVDTLPVCPGRYSHQLGTILTFCNRLTNCGHTFCQGCLTDWFNTTLSQHIQSGTRGMPAYTCPSCRHPARTPPVQNFVVKRLVRLVAESRGESSPQRPQPPPPPPPMQPRARGGGRRDYLLGPFNGFFGR